jgi:hypothetical protein
MSFREKIHWVSFIVIAVTFGWYFLTLPTAAASGSAGLWEAAGLLLLPVLGIIIAMTITTAIFAIRNPREATLRPDERDHDFHVRGTHLAYYPLIAGTWLCIGLIFGGLSQISLLKVLLGTVVAAELVRIGSQIWFYRKGH